MSERRILVVDDDPFVLSAVVRGLRIEGYHPLPVDDGVSALSLARCERPSLAILDWTLRDIDGLSVCRELRTLGELPILMLTARNGVLDRVAGLDSGAECPRRPRRCPPSRTSSATSRPAKCCRAPGVSDLRPRELELLELFLRTRAGWSGGA